MINDGYSGLPVEPSDPDSMAEAILRIHRDKNLREILGQDVRGNVAEYNWEIVNKKIDGALGDLQRRV